MYSATPLVDEDEDDNKHDDDEHGPMLLCLCAQNKIDLMPLLGNLLAMRSLRMLSRVKVVMATGFAGYFLAFLARAYILCKKHQITQMKRAGQVASAYQLSVRAWHQLADPVNEDNGDGDDFDCFQQWFAKPLSRFVNTSHAGNVLAEQLLHIRNWCSSQSEILAQQIQQEFDRNLSTDDWNTLIPSDNLSNYSHEPVFIWQQHPRLLSGDRALISDNRLSLAIYNLASFCATMCDFHLTDEPLLQSSMIHATRYYNRYIRRTEDTSVTEPRIILMGSQLARPAAAITVPHEDAKILVVVNSIPDLPSPVMPHTAHFLASIQRDVTHWCKLRSRHQIDLVNWGKCCVMYRFANKEKHSFISWFDGDYADPHDFFHYFNIGSKSQLHNPLIEHEPVQEASCADEDDRQCLVQITSRQHRD